MCAGVEGSCASETVIFALVTGFRVLTIISVNEMFSPSNLKTSGIKFPPDATASLRASVVVVVDVVVVAFDEPPPPPPPLLEELLEELLPEEPLLSVLEMLPDLEVEMLTDPFVPIAVTVYEHVDVPIVNCHDAELAELCDNDPRLFEDASPDLSEQPESDMEIATSRFPPTRTLPNTVMVAPVDALEDDVEAVNDLKSTTLIVVSAANVSLTESINTESKLFNPELVGRMSLNVAVVDAPELIVVEKPDAE